MKLAPPKNRLSKAGMAGMALPRRGQGSDLVPKIFGNTAKDGCSLARELTVVEVFGPESVRGSVRKRR